MTRLPAPSAVRGLLVSAALLAFLVAIVSPPKAWAAVSTVRVTATNLSTFELPVNLSTLGDPAVDSATYTVRNGSVEVTDGYSLKQILDYAADEDSRLSYSDAESVTVGAIKVMTPDINRPKAKPPVFFQSDSGITFVKSETSSSSAAKASFSSDPLISIRSRAATATIPVTLTASDRKIEAGGTVDFLASATAPSGSNLRYTWTFDDGTSKTTSKPETSHRFRKAGSFDVLLAVTDLVSSSQGGDSVAVEVGEVKKKDKKSGNGGDSTGSYTPPPDYGTGGYEYGTYGGTGDSGTGSPAVPAAPTAPPEPEPASPIDDGLETISGELVSSTAPAATIDPSSPGSPEALQDVVPASDGTVLPREAWVVLGILALFGFGVMAERRGSRLG